ncbi:MAG: sugar phosphate isomerase/epimerase [Clostridiales bacterium]|nr:sugar phosphate isomerase/epimerase [Clostridiales bacterium]
MRALGMYSPELKRCTVERLFDAVKVYGFSEVQFDFRSVCDEQMPEQIDDGLIARIYGAASDRGITIRAVNGTFNMAHPDRRVREDGIRRFREIARACGGLRCSIVTLCTGTRNRESMWRFHEDNNTEQAWDDMIETAYELRRIAQEYQVYLGIETEARNIVNSAEKARKLLDTMDSPWFQIILDPANLFGAENASAEFAVELLRDAFQLLGRDIILAHGKDMMPGGDMIFTSAGRGIVAYEEFLKLLDQYDYRGNIILHGMHDESEFAFSVAFMKELMCRHDESAAQHTA